MKLLPRSVLVALACLGVCCSAPVSAQRAPTDASRPPPEETTVRHSPRSVTVRGRVVDDLGAPIAGASIEISTEHSHRAGPVTDANGEFSVSVPATPAVRLVASHPDYGLQYTDMTRSDWSR